MIVGVGIDNVETRRMKDILMKWVDRVENRVFNEVELEYSKSKGEPHLHLAARFAAKEAFFKALGRRVGWKDAELVNRPSGQPDLLIRKDLEKTFDRVHVSVSHLAAYAIAVVILEKQPDQT